MGGIWNSGEENIEHYGNDLTPFCSPAPRRSGGESFCERGAKPLSQVRFPFTLGRGQRGWVTT